MSERSCTNAGSTAYPEAKQDFLPKVWQGNHHKLLVLQNCNSSFGFETELLLPRYHLPAYCIKCGNAHPWTEAALSAARELVDKLDNLSAEDREQLKDSFEDLVSDTPRTALATPRFKRLVAGAVLMGGVVLIALAFLAWGWRRSYYSQLRLLCYS